MKTRVCEHSRFTRYLGSNVLHRINRILRHLVPSGTAVQLDASAHLYTADITHHGLRAKETEDLVHRLPDTCALLHNKRPAFCPIFDPGYNHPSDVRYMDHDGDIAHAFFEAQQDGALRKVWPLDDIILI